MERKLVLPIAVLALASAALLLVLFMASRTASPGPTTAASLPNPTQAAVQHHDAVISLGHQPEEPVATELGAVGEVQNLLHADLVRQARNFSEFPAHPGRASLQAQMQGESMHQTFERIADDDHLRMLVPALGSVPFSPGAYSADVAIVGKSIIVRKLIEDAQAASSAHASAFYQDQLRQAAKSFPEALGEFQQTLADARGKITLEELPPVQVQRLKNAAAVYLLAEIGAHDALPLLAEISSQGHPDFARPQFPGSCPVNPTFLLYSMHKLVRSLPDTSLSDAARETRRRYLQTAAALGVTEGQSVQRASWRAEHDENDFRLTLPRGLAPPKNQPEINLTLYPAQSHLTGPEVQHLLTELRRLVERAYPNS